MNEDLPILDGCETIACKGTPPASPSQEYAVRGYWRIGGYWTTKIPNNSETAEDVADSLSSSGWQHVHLVKLPTTYPGQEPTP